MKPLDIVPPIEASGQPPATPAIGIGSVSGVPGSGSVSADAVIAAEMPTLRTRALHGSAATTIGYCASQVLRLVNTYVLTRLIVPEEMGLMGMVSVLLQGLEMFSDIGTAPSIIQNRRGGDPEFLNTAWTLQIARGFGLWLLACLCAVPFAVFEHQPRLIVLVIICGSSNVFRGLNSTALVFLSRQLYLGKITILGIAGQIVVLTVTVIWALISPTVWALVAGNYAGVIFQTILSYFVVPGHRNRLAFNREDARAMFKFGRWIFISTALTFFAGYGDKLMFGRLLGPAQFAIYGIASEIAKLPPMFIKKIGGQVAFPMLAEISRERPHMFYRRLAHVRMALIGVSLCLLLPLILFGQQLINLIYRDQWREAGWMLRILAVSGCGGIIISTYGSALFALGKTFQAMFLLVTQLIILVPAALLGYHWYGEKGFIVGVAMVEWLNYPFMAVVAAKSRIWQPQIDFPAMLLSGAAMAVAYWVL